MAAPVYGPKWYEHSEATRLVADKRFQAAVMSARSGSDEAVRQVSLTCLQLTVKFCEHEDASLRLGELRSPDPGPVTDVFGRDTILWLELRSPGSGRELFAHDYMLIDLLVRFYANDNGCFLEHDFPGESSYSSA